MTNRSFERANDESRERLARLAATLTPDRLAVDLGGGWTVASALAHMAFWDRWQAERWRAVLEGEWLADDRSVITSEHLANIGLDPILMRVESDGLPAEAVQAAEVIDRLIASAPDATVEWIEGGLSAYLLHRHRHRCEHLDQIERALAATSGADKPLDRSYLERNDASRARLRELVGRLTPGDLARPISPTEEGSWTVGQTLGHLAFWDRFLTSRWRAAQAAGPSHQPGYLPDELAGLLNAGLEPFLAAFAGGSGAGLMAEVLAAAEAIDGLIASLPAEAPFVAVLANRPPLLDRSVHREAHLDQIESAFGE